MPLSTPWQGIDIGGVGASSYSSDTESFNLSTNSTEGKGIHYAYQELSGNFTAQGCVQSLTSDDPEAKAGLMLRQDNSDTSEYVYIGLMSTGTEVEYVDDTGTVQTVQGQQGISTPVCYKLEREENSVRVYESDDGLNWILVTTIALSLVDPVHIGLAVCASKEVQAVVDDVVVEAQAPPETLTLVPGGKVVGIDGVSVEAPEGAIDEPIEVTIKRVEESMLEIPLPEDRPLFSNLYSINIEDEFIFSKVSFKIYLPLPEGIDGENAIMLSLISTNFVIDSEPGSWFWTFDGAYDESTHSIISFTTILSSIGTVIGITERKVPLSNFNQVTPQSASCDFTVSCGVDGFYAPNPCSSELKAEVQSLFKQVYIDLQGLDFEEPQLAGDDPVLSGPDILLIRSGETLYNCPNDGLGNVKGGWYETPKKRIGLCITSEGITPAGSLRTSVRHEYFHSIQASYKSESIIGGEKELRWFIEGTAEAAVNSLNTMEVVDKDGTNARRHVTKFLYSSDDSYRNQDFWVYVGRKLDNKGLDYLIDILNTGLANNELDVEAALQSKLNDKGEPSKAYYEGGLAQAYWDWAKNQGYEIKEDIGNLSSGFGGRCALKFETVSSTERDQIEFDKNEKSSDIREYSVEAVNSKVAVIKFATAGRFLVKVQGNDKVKSKIYLDDVFLDDEEGCEGNIDGRFVEDAPIIVDLDDSQKNRINVVVLISNTDIQRGNTSDVTLEISVSSTANLDDETPRGAQYMYLDSFPGTGDIVDTNKEDGIDDQLNNEEIVVIHETANYEGPLDIDGNTIVGDSRDSIATAGLQIQAINVVPNIDMSDFRRMRDWLLVGESLDSNLKGSDTHPKKSLNEGSDALTYADYNNDGQLKLNEKDIFTNTAILELEDLGTTEPVGFDFTATGSNITTTRTNLEQHPDQENYPDAYLVNDFEIFYHLIKNSRNEPWLDPHYDLEDIPDLLGSGDIEVWPHYLFANYPQDSDPDTPSVDCVKSEVVGENQTRIHRKGIERDPHLEDYERQIYTLPVGTYTLKVTAFENFEAGDCTGDTAFNFERNFEVKLGSDDLWDPAPPAFDATVNGTLLMEDSVVKKEKLDSEGYYVIELTRPSSPGEQAVCEDVYGYSQEYNTDSNTICLDFSSKAKNITSASLWALTKDGANFATIFAGLETKLDSIPLQLPQEIQGKRLLNVPGTYNLDSTLVANLNEALGYESELNTFEAPTIKVKLIYKEEMRLTANGTELTPDSNPIIGVVGGAGCSEETQTINVDLVGEILSGAIADTISLSGVVSASATNASTVSKSIDLGAGDYTLIGNATITTLGVTTTATAQGSFTIEIADGSDCGDGGGTDGGGTDGGGTDSGGTDGGGTDGGGTDGGGTDGGGTDGGGTDGGGTDGGGTDGGGTDGGGTDGGGSGGSNSSSTTIKANGITLAGELLTVAFMEQINSVCHAPSVEKPAIVIEVEVIGDNISSVAVSGIVSGSAENTNDVWNFSGTTPELSGGVGASYTVTVTVEYTDGGVETRTERFAIGFIETQATPPEDCGIAYGIVSLSIDGTRGYVCVSGGVWYLLYWYKVRAYPYGPNELLISQHSNNQPQGCYSSDDDYLPDAKDHLDSIAAESFRDFTLHPWQAGIEGFMEVRMYSTK